MCLLLQASAKCEKDLSNLTLSEKEQRELFQAAQIIQKAYRSYKGRKKTPTRPRTGFSEEYPEEEGDEEGEDQAKEAKAAVVIQNYYRRYKQVSTAPFNRGLFSCSHLWIISPSHFLYFSFHKSAGEK